MPYETLRLAVADGVATITFARPEVRNALTEAMRADLAAALAEVKAGQMNHIRALVIAGDGPAFCAGGDIARLTASTAEPPAATRARLQGSHELLATLLDLDIPVIAAVQGAAAGAGASIAFACDLVLASPEARFVLSFGRLGLVPDWGAMWLLPRLVGLQRAKELVLTARNLTADEAQAMGLVTRVVPGEWLLATAHAWGRRFAAASPLALSIAKEALDRAQDMDLATALDLEPMAQSVTVTSDYTKDSLARFRNREQLAFDWEALARADGETA